MSCGVTPSTLRWSHDTTSDGCTTTTMRTSIRSYEPWSGKVSVLLGNPLEEEPGDPLRRRSVLDHLGHATDHDSAEIGHVGALVHDARHPWVAPEVHDLARFGVGPERDGAVEDHVRQRARRAASPPDRAWRHGRSIRRGGGHRPRPRSSAARTAATRSLPRDHRRGRDLHVLLGQRTSPAGELEQDPVGVEEVHRTDVDAFVQLLRDGPFTVVMVRDTTDLDAGVT